MAGGGGLVAPIIPNSEDDGIKLFMSAFQLASGRAQQKRALEQQMAEMTQREVLAREQHQIERERMGQNYDLAKLKLDLDTDVKDAQIGLIKQKTEAYKAGVGSAAQRATTYNRAVQGLQTEAMDRYSNVYKLDDPGFQTKDPVGYAANALKWIDEYQYAPKDTGIQDHIKSLRKSIDSNTVALKNGSTRKAVPIYRIIQGLKDPTMQDYTMQSLVDSGLATKFSTNEKVGGFLGIGGTTRRSSSTTINEPMASTVRAGAAVDFTKAQSRVPTNFPKSRAASVGVMTPGQAFGEADGTLNEARAARAEIGRRVQSGAWTEEQGSAALGQLQEKLQAMQIDPSELDDTGEE